MSVSKVRFNKNDKPEFFKVLNKRVNSYFKDNKISKNANGRMVVKTIFMLALYFVPLITLLVSGVSNVWFMFALWAVMGFGMSGIGLSVMHDANHGAYSKSKKVNKLIGFVINFLGGYHHNWIIQHNVLHHSFTNVHGHDEDIEKGIIRMSPEQDQKSYFKYQIVYAPLLYSIMTLYWCTTKDFEQLFRYRRTGMLEKQGLGFGTTFAQIVFHKIWYFALTLILPMVLLPFAWYTVLAGFLLMHAICGMILALIFQPAHVIEGSAFCTPDEQGSVENNWAIHQMMTTTNFARESKLFSWFVGGLNYQIEHHLFPHTCHVHYRHISSIVKSTAKEFNVPYNEQKTFFGAVKSHLKLLHRLGVGGHDEEIKEEAARRAA